MIQMTVATLTRRRLSHSDILKVVLLSSFIITTHSTKSCTDHYQPWRDAQKYVQGRLPPTYYLEHILGTTSRLLSVSKIKSHNSTRWHCLRDMYLLRCVKKGGMLHAPRRRRSAFSAHSRYGCYIYLGRCVVSKNEPAKFKLSCTGRLMNISWAGSHI